MLYVTLVVETNCYSTSDIYITGSLNGTTGRDAIIYTTMNKQNACLKKLLEVRFGSVRFVGTIEKDKRRSSH